MGRGKKQQRPAIGMPARVLVMHVAGGWAHSVVGVGCGRPDPAIVDAAGAKAVAAETVTGLALRDHGMIVEIDREQRPDGDWAGQVRVGVAR